MRRVGKFILFVAGCLVGIVTGIFSRRRSAWLRRQAVWGCRLVNLRVTVRGDLPRRGLIVANHLGYLDIPLLAGVMPCAFVAKREVRRYPLLGRVATLAGTVFIDRANIRDLTPVIAQMKERLRQNIPVVLFPEGTSSDGTGVLPFRPSLLQAALELDAPLIPAYISYAAEVSYWGDMNILSHMWKLFGRREPIRAEIRFGAPLPPVGDRKQLAARLHAEVVRLGLDLSPAGA